MFRITKAIPMGAKSLDQCIFVGCCKLVMTQSVCIYISLAINTGRHGWEQCYLSWHVQVIGDTWDAWPQLKLLALKRMHKYVVCFLSFPVVTSFNWTTKLAAPLTKCKKQVLRFDLAGTREGVWERHSLLYPASNTNCKVGDEEALTFALECFWLFSWYLECNYGRTGQSSWHTPAAPYQGKAFDKIPQIGAIYTSCKYWWQFHWVQKNRPSNHATRIFACYDVMACPAAASSWYRGTVSSRHGFEAHGQLQKARGSEKQA